MSISIFKKMASLHGARTPFEVSGEKGVRATLNSGWNTVYACFLDPNIPRMMGQALKKLPGHRKLTRPLDGYIL
jgi:hypothetical protein